MSEATTVTVGSMQPELATRAQNMLELAQSYRIDCPEMRAAASEDLKHVKALAGELDKQRKDITTPLDVAKKRVMDLFRGPAEFLEQAEMALKRACRLWDDEQDRRRREAQAAAALKADQDRKRLEAEAAKAREAGNAETAHAISQAAQMVAPAPFRFDMPQKIAGESTRELWSAKVDDIVALCRGVAVNIPMLQAAIDAGKIGPEVWVGTVSSECVLPNMPTLNSQARALKGTLSIPGVRAVMEKSLASRAA